MTEAIILAAGRSSRMGRAKALLPIGGVTSLERVAGSLRAAGVERIVVVTGHEHAALLPPSSGFRCSACTTPTTTRACSPRCRPGSRG